MKTIDVLKKARALLAKRGGWIKGANRLAEVMRLVFSPLVK